jgi:REP element-mobilizing transposase RayT
MARALRIEYPGAVYHVMARGNQGRPIFKDDPDRKRFLETLGEAAEKTGIVIHAYVLMGNHYHLLLETPEGNLVAALKWLQGAYTQRYNGRHKVFGHLFQGRYKAVIVDPQESSYFQVVSTYIHLNPARAGMIRVGQERLKRYRWSSYPWYLNRAGKGPKWLRRDRVMGSLGMAEGERKGYEAYIEERVLELGMKDGRKELEEEWKKLRRGWYVGGDGFVERLHERLKKAMAGRRRESHSGGAKNAHDDRAAELRLADGLRALGVEASKLEDLPKAAPEKIVLAWWLRERTAVTIRWVSEQLKMGHFTRVTQAVCRMKERPGWKLERLRKKLTHLDKQTG